MPANTPVWKGYPEGTLAETAASGELRLGERVTYTTQHAGRYADAVAYALAHPRGSSWVLSIAGTAGTFYVEEASCSPERGGKGIVSVTYALASGASAVPADEFSLTPFEINPAVEKNPYFSALDESDLTKARARFNAATAAGQTSVDAAIDGITNKALVKKLLEKWGQGIETFYLAGFHFSHTLHFTACPTLSAGGFIQDPFGAFSGYVLGAGMTWRREADEVVWSNGLWKLTRTWTGAPASHWDPDLYS
ncbi:MAG TPA: hypothetical protein PKI20_05915 [Verrucomicrobiota bacterium]|jgi:hypothetical protein|nr:hypothetical protein [Verrucomicrobiota bacterium]HQL77170.1 hypothetical protein [Verrucomicrobiota bacterium]